MQFVLHAMHRYMYASIDDLCLYVIIVFLTFLIVFRTFHNDREGEERSTLMYTFDANKRIPKVNKHV